MAKRKPVKHADETHLQRQSRLSRERDLAAQRNRPLVADSVRQHGDYHDGWTEHDGQRARVVINRGGSTVQRWLNGPHDDHIGAAEKAAIRYCISLWQRIDRKGPRMVRVDGDNTGLSEHEALAELAGFKRRLPRMPWRVFEDICRFELPSSARHARVTVGLVASMVALWKGY